MRKKVVKISLLLISLMLSITFPILAVTAKKDKLVLDPVYIDELVPGYTWADWADEPWLKGSGTFEDPYMIIKIVIDGDGSVNCMRIWNSEAYFKIMDCIFYNTKPPLAEERNSGIYLDNTKNGVIFKNQFYDNGWMGAEVGSGIALINSDNNKIQKNILIDNAATGIYLENSDNNIVVDNYVSGSLWGIMLWNIGTGSSDGNLIARNDCIDNIETGIVVGWSYGNTVTQNLCKGNTWGISIGTWAGYNIVTQNDCEGNSNSGMIIHENAFNNEIIENDCSGNSQNGILVYNNANNNRVTDNDCKENLASGIAVVNSNGNIITDNNCSNSGTVGIYLENAHYNILERNDCRENGASGIMVVYSNENAIDGNNCTRNSYGIYITASYGNDLTENICSESYYEHGILIMDNSGYNMISRNICFKNARSGIVVYNYAYNNIITENICYENFESGIVLDSSFQNTVENNLVYGNSYTGMQVYNAENNMIVGNIFNENYIGLHIISDYNHWMNSNYNEITNNVCNDNIDSGILVVSSDGNTITNNDCMKNLAEGIDVENSNGNIITENHCSENERPGIYLKYSNDNLITQNLCTGSPWGIVIRWSNNNEVTKNDCIENGEGIVIQNEATDNRITENTCTNNYENGIILWDNANYNIISQNNFSENLLSGIWVASSSNTILSKNDCNNNGESGISITNPVETYARDNILYGNKIAGNLNGIHLSEANNNDIFRNIIKGNDIGMLIEGQSELNLIYHNNFIDNVVQAVNEHAGLNNWHNIYMLEGNYWSDYTGIDSDGDGIGDEPWPWWDFDAYPFMVQDGWDILTAQEEELLNAFFDPESNRLKGYSTVRSDETCYIMIGMIQLFSERIDRIFSPPFTAHFEFFDVVYPFQGSFLWFWEDFPGYGEPGYTQFFYIILPPYYFPYVGLPPGEYSYTMSFSFYMDGVYNEFAYDSVFYLV